MAEVDKLFAGSIPEIYDRLLVPLIFEPYARDLAERIAGTKPEDVLETAAGTGVLTSAIVSHLAPGSRITSTDLNQPMLDAPPRGKGLKVASPGDRPMRWHCRSGSGNSTSSRANSAPCSSPTGSRVTRRPAACSGHGVVFSSTYGTPSTGTSLPMWSHKALAAVFPHVRPCSWPALRTAITTSKSSASN